MPPRGLSAHRGAQRPDVIRCSGLTETNPRVLFKVQRNSIDPLRDAIAHLRSTDNAVTLDREMARAIENHVALLRRERNDGEPFPVRNGELQRGRPRGSRGQQRAPHYQMRSVDSEG